MRKSDLRSSRKSGKVTCWFYAFERSMLTDKRKEDLLRRWTLKRFLVIFRTKLDLWVDFSLNFTLVINQFIQGNFQRKTSDWFFWLFYLKIFWLFYYYFSRYFDYFIIILLFWFNRGYNVNDRLDFVLRVIKWDYNTNDRLKFILSFIRRDSGLNDRLKLVKNRRKENRKWTK